MTTGTIEGYDNSNNGQLTTDEIADVREVLRDLHEARIVMASLIRRIGEMDLEIKRLRCGVDSALDYIPQGCAF